MFFCFLAKKSGLCHCILIFKVGSFPGKKPGVVTAKQAQKVSKNHGGDLRHRPKGGIGKNGALPWKLPQESVATKKKGGNLAVTERKVRFFFACLESWRMRACKKCRLMFHKTLAKNLEENRTNIYQNGSFCSLILFRGPPRDVPQNQLVLKLGHDLVGLAAGINWTKASNPVSWKPPDWLTYTWSSFLLNPNALKKLLYLTWKLKRMRFYQGSVGVSAIEPFLSGGG